MTEPNATPLTPHPDGDRLNRAIKRCVTHLTTWSGVMYRATGIDYATKADLLSGLGSKLHGARWTPRGAFPAVYGSLTPESALLETLGTGGRYGVPFEERMPLVMVAVDVSIERLLDLTSREVGKALRVSVKRMLEEDWGAKQRAGEEALAQAVARLARDLGAQALLVPSARLREARNLVIFPEKLSDRGLRIQNVGKLPESKRG